MDRTGFRLAHLPQLDGLRGTAILAVMIFHAEPPFLAGAFIGVDVFFVLSGFLITSLLIHEFDRTGAISLRTFYVRRLFRLGPALVLMLAVFCLASLVLLEREAAQRNLVDALICLGYMTNWARAFGVHASDFLGHTWSLSIEEQFYVFWPLVLLGLLKFTRHRGQVALAAAGLAGLSWFLRAAMTWQGAPIERVYNGLDTRLDALMIGCAVAAALSSGQMGATVSRWTTRLAPVALLGLLAFCVVGNWMQPWIYTWGLFAVAVGAAILIVDVVLRPGSLIGRALAAQWLAWVGTISYGLYLWHYPIFRSLSVMGYGWPATLAIGTLATFAVSMVSYHLVERPLLRRAPVSRWGQAVPIADTTPAPIAP
ncbi:acyltransferase family protein [Arenimonas oryziterrae]|uniref:Acyltransferase 3 domain-containing protein n=1 Tax=Arenimonas oryziterrae DSM 21050 = YC6267 TaxID=1121015 RepID=A0A091ASD0_9GAMM|nr:acyltransferase [Arenimonas oryziterrae]KFN43088.1 hypothetical protein N789_11030 [Arenimonas oryziterrae DSM 21050 = YC6267]